MTANDVYEALHELVGRCGHCGNRKCPHRKGHSVLPGSVSMETVHAALRMAKEKSKVAAVRESV